MRRVVNIEEFDRLNNEGSYVLNASIDSLLANQNQPNLLRDILYTAYVQIKEENLHEPLGQHFITKSLNRLFSSHLKEKAIETSLELYIEFLEDEFSDMLLQFTMNAFENKTIELLGENNDAYFLSLDLSQMSGVEQIRYCLHVINVITSATNKGGNSLRLDITSISWVTPKLFFLCENSIKSVQRIAIWALYWVKKWEYLNSKFQKIEGNKLALLFNLLSADFDSNTKFRICLIVLRDAGITIPDMSGHFTLDLAKNISKEWKPSKAFSKPYLIIPSIIENTLIELLDAPNIYWVEKICVPVLASYASEYGLEKLVDIFYDSKEKRVKAGVILFGWGILTKLDFELSKTDIIELDRWIISMSGHLINELKAKDSSGNMAYYFVLVEPEYQDEFNKFVPGIGNKNLNEYGRVIASCYGEEPSQVVKDFLKKKYGIFV
jgi:hypothetical protein